MAPRAALAVLPAHRMLVPIRAAPAVTVRRADWVGGARTRMIKKIGIFLMSALATKGILVAAYYIGRNYLTARTLGIGLACALALNIGITRSVMEHRLVPIAFARGALIAAVVYAVVWVIRATRARRRATKATAEGIEPASE